MLNQDSSRQNIEQPETPVKMPTKSYQEALAKAKEVEGTEMWTYKKFAIMSIWDAITLVLAT